MKRFQIRYLCVLFATLLSVGTVAFAQNDRATITGTVSDPSGAVLPGVQVMVTDTDTGLGHPGVTNASGMYTIPALPVGNYSFSLNLTGFKDYQRTNIILIAAQVFELNVHMTIGSAAETIVVDSGAPLIETETTSVSMTMEESALRDLPLDATGGRDALNLLLANTPMVSTAAGGQQLGSIANENIIAGQVDLASSVYVDGLESTTGFQGQIATPGLDALSEVQLVTSPSDAQFGTAGGVELFQIKSGTDKFHGSAFEIMQNEDLNANSWNNNYFLAQCAAGDSACRANNSRGSDRFNDYGASAGGPIWKKHTYIFGDFEKYVFRDYQLSPNSITVPTPQMLTGDFSQLLDAQGQNQGPIYQTLAGTASNDPSQGIPWINPCTGQAYQYGQIFDPSTQKQVDGVTCATPFPGNVIPSGRISGASKQVAALYAKDLPPTITTRPYDNAPNYVSGNPSLNKFTLDLKLDHTFSERHHLSAGLNHVDWNELAAGCNGQSTSYTINPNSPLNCNTLTNVPTMLYRVVDDFAVTPNLINNFAVGFGEARTAAGPVNSKSGPSTVGLGSYPGSSYFPQIVFDGSPDSSGTNGIAYAAPGNPSYLDFNTNAYQYQDTAVWMKGRHSIKFGTTIKFQEFNSNWGGNISDIYFSGKTGGPLDRNLTPWVGSAFSNLMVGDVDHSYTSVNNSAYPRQQQYALFFQDDYKIKPKLTLNLGLRWDMTTRAHEKYGHLQNWDINASNPNWAPYKGAWVFSKNSGTSFETNEDYHEFGPHLGAAYQITDKLVGRASIGLFYVPNDLLNMGWGANFPGDQTALAFPTNQVSNPLPGTIAFNWDNQYPGKNFLSPQNSTATTISAPNVITDVDPNYLHPGYSDNWYLGAEYAVNNKMSLNLSYVANRGYNLESPDRSFHRSYPSYNTYQPLMLSGNIGNSVTDAASAAQNGVPYPYAGFSGTTQAAISPFPQVASTGLYMGVWGNHEDSAVSAFNAFVVEAKARDYHGLVLDFSYTLSKMTGDDVGLHGWAVNNWWEMTQSEFDWADQKHWIQPYDQKHLAKGYVTYQLPIGRGKMLLPNSSRLVDVAIGGWKLGYNGSYGSGMPMGIVPSGFGMPGYYGPQRANLAPGLTTRDMHNNFHGHLDLGNQSDPSNSDYSPSSFRDTNAQAPFGNTPFYWNHWRWNPGAAHENMSLMKSFQAVEGIHVIISSQFFDVFNRHYYGAPNAAWGGVENSMMGQVTSVSGYRYGQVSARVEW